MSQERDELGVDSREEVNMSPRSQEAEAGRDEKRKDKDPIFGERAGKKVCITPDEIELLINEAWEGAERAQGSGLAWRPGHSQREDEFNKQLEEGSEDLHGKGSQMFHLTVRRLLKATLKGAGQDIKVGSVGSFVVDALEYLEGFQTPSCRPRSIAGKGELFPIPVGAIPPHDEPHFHFLRAVVVGLNSLHSFGDSGTGEKLSPAALRVCKRLDGMLRGSAVLDEPLPSLDFSQFFGQRGLDYTGEEARLALPIVWKSVESSLPPEVGCLDIRDFCYGGVAHFINHIDETILDVADQVRLRPPSVMIQGDGWEEVATGLVSRGLCEVVSEESIFKIGGKLLLNGLFSVSKDEVKDDVQLARLIMNLKPWNRISRSLEGDVSTLPSVTQLGSLQLHDDDVLLTSSEDLRCFFYLFRVPPAWTKYMAFGKEAPRKLVPPGGEGKRWFLAGRVLPMGYLNSVGIAQHIHRAVVQKAIGSINGLGLTVQEIRRDRGFSCFPNFPISLESIWTTLTSSRK